MTWLFQYLIYLVTLSFRYNAKSGRNKLFFTKNRFGVDLFVAMNPLWRYYSFLHFTLAKKHNLDNLIKQIKKVVIKIGDVLILVKIIQVNCIGNLCLDFNFGKNLMKIVPYSINKGLMGPKLEFSA